MTFLAALALAAAGVSAHAFEGRVVHVQDGDTLTVLVDRREVNVRLASIDAPEVGKGKKDPGQPFGRAAKEELAAMCAGGTAYVEDLGLDWRKKRTLGNVRCGSLDVNAELVRRGLAWVYVQYAPKGSPLYAVEADARATSRGLWADQRPVPPWEWRARSRKAEAMRPH